MSSSDHESADAAAATLSPSASVVQDPSEHHYQVDGGETEYRALLDGTQADSSDGQPRLDYVASPTVGVDPTRTGYTPEMSRNLEGFAPTQPILISPLTEEAQLYATPQLPATRSGTLSPDTSQAGSEVFDATSDDPLVLLSSLKRIEKNPLYPRWANVDWLPHRVVHFLTTGRWMRGHGDPTEHKPSIAKAYFKEEFLEGFLFVIGRGLTLGIALIILVEFSNAASWRDVLTILRGGEKHALTTALYDLSTSEPLRNSVYGLMALPVLWGLIRGTAGYNRVDESDKDGRPFKSLDQAIRHLQQEVVAQESRTTMASFWHDALRWLLPLPPRGRDFSIVSRALRWDGRLDLLHRQKAHLVLIELFERSSGYTRVIAGLQVARTLNALNVEDDNGQTAHALNRWLMETVAADLQSPSLLAEPQVDTEFFFETLKERALTDIVHASIWPEEIRIEPIWRRTVMFCYFVHARYLRWWLGLAPTKIESFFFWTFKLAKLGYAALFFKTLYEAFHDYIRCPTKHFQTFVGRTSYVGKYDLACLNATLAHFNNIPDQPPSTLVSLLPNFYSDIRTRSNFSLDLSAKRLDAATLADIIDGFRSNGFVITTLDLSNNGIGLASTTSVPGLTRLADAISRLTSLRVLNLAANDIGKCVQNDGGVCGDFDPAGLSHLAQALVSLTKLEVLRLDHNYIGQHDDLSPVGTVALGHALGQLTSLQSLNLDANYIGLHDDKDTAGTIAFAQGIGKLVTLRSLYFRMDSFASHDNANVEGTTSIAEAIGQLTSLRELYLSGSMGCSDDTNAAGTIAIGNAIGHLTDLTVLSLGNHRAEDISQPTCIGKFDGVAPDGTIAIGNALRNLTALQTLEIIGAVGSQDATNPNGTRAIGQGMRHLSALQVLVLDRNAIGTADAHNSQGTEAIGEAISHLPHLLHLHLKMNSIGAGDQTASHGTVALGNGIKQCTSLQSLHLEGNRIGIADATSPNGTIALTEGIGSAVSLKSLGLANNMIGEKVGSASSSIQALNNAFARLKRLQRVSIDGNPFEPAVWQLFKSTLTSLPSRPQMSNVFITAQDVDLYFRGVPRLQSSFSFAGRLRCDASVTSAAMLRRLMSTLARYPVLSLDLSGNHIGQNDHISPEDSIAIGEGLQGLPYLQSLDLQFNAIGEQDHVETRGTVSIAQGISQLRSLTTLKLGFNSIGKQDATDAAGTIALGSALSELANLRALRIQNNYIGSGDNEDPRGTRAIAEGIGSLSQLTILDLSSNPIALHDGDDAAGTIALGQAMGKLTSLKALRITGHLGQFDDVNPDGTLAFAQGLASLSNLQALELVSFIGYRDEDTTEGTVALAESLKNLINLHELTLGNYIGVADCDNPTGTVALGQAIGELPNLSFLNLSSNYLGSCDGVNPQGTTAVAHGLFKLTKLKSLYLNDNHIGAGDAVNPQATLALANALASLRNTLRVFNATGNQIGSKTNVGEIAISQSLAQLPQLCYLDLSGNPIGSTGADGPNALMTALAVPRRQLLHFNIQGIQNVDWTRSARAISEVWAKQLRSSCEDLRCVDPSKRHEQVCDLTFSDLRIGGNNRFTRAWKSPTLATVFSPVTLACDATQPSSMTSVLSNWDSVREGFSGTLSHVLSFPHDGSLIVWLPVAIVCLCALYLLRGSRLWRHRSEN